MNERGQFEHKGEVYQWESSWVEYEGWSECKVVFAVNGQKIATRQECATPEVIVGWFHDDLNNTLADEIFTAIRSHELLGKGSCSSVDECMTDDELRADIARSIESGSYRSVQEAIDIAIYIETVFWERNGLFNTEWHKADEARQKAGRKVFGE
jgi:hypothetical protein